jgi:hypothetical protein
LFDDDDEEKFTITAPVVCRFFERFDLVQFVSFTFSHHLQIQVSKPVIAVDAAPAVPAAAPVISPIKVSSALPSVVVQASDPVSDAADDEEDLFGGAQTQSYVVLCSVVGHA